MKKSAKDIEHVFGCFCYSQHINKRSKGLKSNPYQITKSCTSMLGGVVRCRSRVFVRVSASEIMLSRVSDENLGHKIGCQGGLGPKGPSLGPHLGAAGGRYLFYETFLQGKGTLVLVIPPCGETAAAISR